MTSSQPLAEPHAWKPRAFALELTQGCNLRCGYCYYAERDVPYDPRKRMSVEVAERSVDMLFAEGSEDPAQPIHLHFFGGEPLLNFPLLQHVVAYAEGRATELGRQVTFEVTTNGTRFDDDVIGFLNEHAVKVGVSLDGPPDVQDAARPLRGGSSYGLLAPGLARFLASRRGTPLAQKTHASVVVTRRETDLLRLTRHLEELGFERILLTPATDLGDKVHGFRDEDLPELLASYDVLAADYEGRVGRGERVTVTWFSTLMGRLLSGERRTSYCGGGLDYLGVAASGDVHLCYRFLGDREFAMGSVQEGIDRGVTERLQAHSMDQRTTCSACWARHFCGGGCHHDNVHQGGGLGEPNPVTCDIFRHGMGRTLEAWARLSRAGHLPRRRAVAAPQGQNGAGTMTESEPYGDADRPRVSPACHARDLDGEKVVYDPTTHEVVVLNATAAFILERCDGEHSVEEIARELVERYDAPAEVLHGDLLATLADLRARRILA